MSRRVLVLLGVLAALSAIPLVGGGASAADRPVVVTTTGDHSERLKKLPVTRAKRGKPVVVMSLNPNKMPSLQAGDLLRLTAELQTTNNCFQRTALCISHPPYRYSPKIGTQILLAKSADATGGPKTIPITKRSERDCDQAEHNRQHHCVRVYPGSSFRVPAQDEMPCRFDRCRINFVADAHNPHAHSGDLLALGIDRPGGKVSSDRSRLNLTRLRGGGNAPRKPHTQALRRHRVPIKEGPKYSIASLRLRDLEAGDQLTFSASAKVDIRRLSYATFTGSQLVLAEGPGATHASPMTRTVGSLDGEITEANGFNCTQHTTPCRIRRAGTLVVQQTPMRNGHPVDLFANLVLRNAPKEVPDDVHDVMRLRRGGISARLYR